MSAVYSNLSDEVFEKNTSIASAPGITEWSFFGAQVDSELRFHDEKRSQDMHIVHDIWIYSIYCIYITDVFTYWYWFIYVVSVYTHLKYILYTGRFICIPKHQIR